MFAACNKLIYSRAVIKFRFSNYDLHLTNIARKATVNLKDCIRKTCHSIFKPPVLKTKAVSNKLETYRPPIVLKDLNRLWKNFNFSAYFVLKSCYNAKKVNFICVTFHLKYKYKFQMLSPERNTRTTF